MRTTQLLAAFFAASSLGAAFSPLSDSGNALAEVKNMLLGRQDNNDSEGDRPTPTDQTNREEPTPSGDGGSSRPANDSPTPTNNDDKPEETGDAEKSGSESGSGTTRKPTGTGTRTGTRTGKPKTSFGNDIPPGGVNMITPVPFAGPQYYKVDDFVTFVFNITSVKISPNAVDVLATCTANQGTYTLAVNMTVQETNTVIWDTKKAKESANPPFLTENYKLLIFDSTEDEDTIPQPGYMAAYNQHQFGMYTKQPYVGWEQFECPTCDRNGALSPTEALTLKALAVMSGTTIASLLYFAHSFGVL